MRALLDGMNATATQNQESIMSMYHIVPTTDINDTYAAGEDGNSFDTLEEAATAAVLLVTRCGEDFAGPWYIVDGDGEVVTYNLVYDALCGFDIYRTETGDYIVDSGRKCWLRGSYLATFSSEECEEV